MGFHTEVDAGRLAIRRPSANGFPDDNALPNLFEAIQQQLGLKLDAVKIPVDVMVIDRVEKPSEN